MALTAGFFYLFAVLAVVAGVMVIVAQKPRARGAVPDPRLLQRGRAVHAARRRVPGDDPGRRLCRRGRGAVPVRRHDARRRLRRAEGGLHQVRCRRRCWSAASCSPSSCCCSSAAACRAGECRARRRRLPRRAPASPTPRRSGACSTRSYVYFFEVAGLILLVAMIGAIVLTLRHKAGVKRQSIAAQVARRPRTASRSSRCRLGAIMPATALRIGDA